MCVNVSAPFRADVRGVGVVAGAVVGVSFGVLLIILIVWLVLRKKEKKKYEEEETPNEIRSASLKRYSFNQSAPTTNRLCHRSSQHATLPVWVEPASTAAPSVSLIIDADDDATCYSIDNYR